MSQNGRHVPQDLQQHRRTRAIVAVGAVVLLAALGGAWIASRADGGDPTVAVSPTPSPSTPTSPSPAGSSSTSPSPSETSSSVAPAALEDGEHFLRATRVLTAGATPRLRFDEAVFSTGDEAFEYAQENDIELQNDYYIENASPKVAMMPLAADAVVSYIPQGTCCELQPGSVDGLVASVNATAMTDYPDPATTWWWATVEEGEITSLVQQYLP